MRLTTGVVLWVVAAVAATAVGLVAVSAIGTDIFGAGQDPLSQSEVDELLANRPSSTAPSTGPSTAPPTTSSTPPPPEKKVTETEGGTVISRCEGALVRVLSRIPAQGYRVDSDDDELEDHPSVKFKSGEQEIEVRLRCVDGAPSAEISYDD